MWKILQRPRLLGAAVVALIGFGIWMGGKLDGLGLGTGGGTGVGINQSPTKLVDSHTDDGKPAKSGLPAAREKALDVVIEGKDGKDAYALRQRVDGKEEFIPLSLSQVVELAKESPGDAEGIRVRVFRRGSALPTGEKALAAALRDANIADSAVLTAEGLLD